MSTCTLSASAVSNGPRFKDGKIMPFHTKGTARTARALRQSAQKKEKKRAFSAVRL